MPYIMGFIPWEASPESEIKVYNIWSLGIRTCGSERKERGVGKGSSLGALKVYQTPRAILSNKGSWMILSRIGEGTRPYICLLICYWMWRWPRKECGSVKVIVFCLSKNKRGLSAGRTWNSLGNKSIVQKGDLGGAAGSRHTWVQCMW